MGARLALAELGVLLALAAALEVLLVRAVLETPLALEAPQLRPSQAALGGLLAAALGGFLAAALGVLLARAVLEALLGLEAPQLRPLQAAASPKAGRALAAPPTRICLLGKQQRTG